MKKHIKIIPIKPHTKAWYEYRQTGLGGSEIATMMGLNPYQSRLRLYHSKVGDIVSDNFDSERMFMGRYDETKISDGKNTLYHLRKIRKRND